MARISRYGILVVLFVVGIMSGCVSSDLTGFTDKDFEGYQISKIAIRATDGDLQLDKRVEDTLVKAFNKQGVTAESFIKLYPPTRTWSDSEVAQNLADNGFDTILYVSALNSEITSRVVGYSVSGNASTYGNTTSGHAIATENRRYRRDTSLHLTIYEVKSAKTIWVADCKTVAGGTLFMADSTQYNSFTSALVKALKKSGHIAKIEKESK